MTWLEKLREAGWSVAVHNDYRLNSKTHTFWLFTHPNGRWVKGEAETDAEALELAWRDALLVAEIAVSQASTGTRGPVSSDSGFRLQLFGELYADRDRSQIGDRICDLIDRMLFGRGLGEAPAEPCMACKGAGGKVFGLGALPADETTFVACQYCRGTGKNQQIPTAGDTPAKEGGPRG